MFATTDSLWGQVHTHTHLVYFLPLASGQNDALKCFIYSKWLLIFLFAIDKKWRCVSLLRTWVCVCVCGRECRLTNGHVSTFLNIVLQLKLAIRIARSIFPVIPLDFSTIFYCFIAIIPLIELPILFLPFFSFIEKINSIMGKKLCWRLAIRYYMSGAVEDPVKQSITACLAYCVCVYVMLCVAASQNDSQNTTRHCWLLADKQKHTLTYSYTYCTHTHDAGTCIHTHTHKHTHTLYEGRLQVRSTPTCRHTHTDRERVRGESNELIVKFVTKPSDNYR